MEMVVVLAIMVLLTGFFAVRFGESAEERLLSPLARDLSSLARRGVTEASAYREDYAILLDSRQVRLVRGHGVGAGGAIAVQVEDALSIPEGVELAARRPGDESWRRVDGEAWLFRSGGLCEPLVLRMESGTGKTRAFVELSFDPLTGMADERSFFP